MDLSEKNRPTPAFWEQSFKSTILTSILNGLRFLMFHFLTRISKPKAHHPQFKESETKFQKHMEFSLQFPKTTAPHQPPWKTFTIGFREEKKIR